MAITTYTAGQVLTAASLNNNFASGGLQLIKTQTVGSAVGSVTVTGAFSATYNNYRIVYTGGTASAPCDIGVTVGSTAANYYFSFGYIPYGGAMAVVTVDNGAGWLYVGGGSTALAIVNCDVFQPFATTRTIIASSGGNASNGNFGGGYLNDATSYTAFTITPTGGTLTGGTIRVYGYVNS